MAELVEPAAYDPVWRRWSLEHLPLVPAGFKLRLREGVADQYRVIERLLNEADEVVNACDAGREGELIFRYVAQLAGCSAPVLRLWVSSLTDEALRSGLASLRPGQEFDRLADAARSRAESDWLVGLNATRALTCRARQGGGQGLLTVGRVQTPTLAMIVGRRQAIEGFEPESFWQIKAMFAAENGQWEATWFRGKGSGPPPRGRDAEPTPDERLPDEAAAGQVAQATKDGSAEVTTARRKRTREQPPLLFDLTSLQRRANQRYGLSAQKTLEVAQALYERRKVLTYPRTDARYLTPDQVPGLPDVVRGLQPIAPYTAVATALLAAPIQPGKRVVDASEVGDHHAIVPTGRTPSGALSADEKRVFDLVARRFLAALSEDAVFDVSTLIVSVSPAAGANLPSGVDTPLRYRARGRVCRQAGWRTIDPPASSRQVDLPPVEENDPVDVAAVRVAPGKTRPPRPFNDGTLLRAMETAGRALSDDALIRALRGKGLGTPATRAAILQTLLARAYVERRGKELHATDQGCALIAAIPVAALKSAELTGGWEGRLTDLAEGRPPGRAAFMDEVVAWVGEVTDAIAAADPAALRAGDQEPALGDCPGCAAPVRRRGPVWSCDTGRDCPFVVFETMSKRKISERMVKRLLCDGQTPVVKGFRSKAGRAFSAGLRWDPEARRVSFLFPPREGDACPDCGLGKVIRGKRTLGCSRWREGCGYVSKD